MLNMVHKMDITLLLHMQTGWLYSWMNGTVVGAQGGVVVVDVVVGAVVWFGFGLIFP